MLVYEKEERKKEDDESDFFGGLFLSSGILKCMFTNLFVNC